MKLTSEITNDPNRNYSLVIELLADEQYFGRLFIDEEKLQLELYPSKKPLIVPAVWVKTVIDKAQIEFDDKKIVKPNI